MATYAIGDVQGCFSALEKLLTQLQFNNEHDTLWFTGDLVNRGRQSLEVLRFIKSLGDKHVVVLGNHDLHLIAVAYKTKSLNTKDTLNTILSAPDCEELIDWLRMLPLLHHDEKSGYVLTHAGVAPMWTLTKAKQLAREVEAILQSDTPQLFLAHMYGNQPDGWNDNLSGTDRLRCIVNYFTRMRFCYADGRLDLTYKGTIQDKPANLFPWFNVVPRANEHEKIIFGHWAALGGATNSPNLFALDTGCVWGNCLTAMRLEDEKLFAVKC